MRLRERVRQLDERLRRLDARFERAGVPQVEDSDWIDLATAAQTLGMPADRLRGLPPGKLRRALNSDGTLGITKQSVADELQWRATASPGARLRRRIGDALGWLS